MKTITRAHIENLLQQGRVALDNAKSTSEILNLLTPFGYGDSKLSEGIVQRDNLHTKYQDQIRFYAQQQEATNQLKITQQNAKILYDRHYTIAKALLKQTPELMTRLGLKGKRAGKLNLWIEQANQFYRESLADPAIMILFAQGGLNTTILDEGKLAIRSVSEMDNAQESAKGLAQQSTRDRNEAYLQFKTWMGHFWKIVDDALADHPQWIERLGRQVKS